jgi:Flp pilus assembly protein TadD
MDMVVSATSAIARLELVSGKTPGRSFELAQDRVNIGRDGTNVICLDHTTVSLHHAILVRTGDHYRVRDLISTNGTYLNGERTTGAQLRHGDILRFGEVQMRYEVLEQPAPESKGDAKPTVLPLGRSRPISPPSSAREKQYKIVGADGRTYGPANVALVRRWILQGFANAQSWAPAEARGNWKQLGDLPEFAEALADNATPTHLLGTPPKDARWEEPIKVGPGTEAGVGPGFEAAPSTVTDGRKPKGRSLTAYAGAFLLLAVVAGGIAAWWFNQWPFSLRGPLRKYARGAEGYIYADPDYTAAAAAEDAKNYTELLRDARLLVAHYPDSSLAQYILGVAYGKLKFFPDAATAFQQAIKLKPDYIDAWNNLGWAYTESGKFADAVNVFQQLIEFTPNDAKVWSDLGGAQAALGHTSDAIAAYHMTIQLKPDDADAHFHLGAALANQGAFVDAVNSFRLALKYKPDYADAWFNLGVVSNRQGENNDAVVFFQKAVKLRPDYAEAWGGLVKSYLALHQPDKAGEAAHEMKRIDPAKADQLADELSHEEPAAPPPQPPPAVAQEPKAPVQESTPSTTEEPKPAVPEHPVAPQEPAPAPEQPESE